MKDRFCISGSKNEWQFGGNFRFFNLLSKSTLKFPNNFKSFVFRGKRTNSRLGANLDIVFRCKNRMAVWVQQ